MSVRGHEVGDDEAGVTLLELVISVMILGIVIAAIFGVLASLTAADRRAQQRVLAQENIRLTLADIGRDLRSAQRLDIPLDRITARSEVAFIAANGDHVRWKLDAGTKTLQRSVLPPTATVWPAGRTIANVRNGDDGTDLFRYYGAGNQRLDANSTVLPIDIAACTLRMRLTLKVGPADVTTPYASTLDIGLRNRGSRGVKGC